VNESIKTKDAGQASVVPALLTLRQSAQYLGGTSRDRIYQLIDQGKLDSILLSPRARRVTKQSLDRYIANLMRQENHK
jgi:excisionase family DNA binding protein